MIKVLKKLGTKRTYFNIVTALCNTLIAITMCNRGKDSISSHLDLDRELTLLTSAVSLRLKNRKERENKTTRKRSQIIPICRSHDPMLKRP